MAEDGLLFRCFSVVNETTKTPVIATLVSGILAGEDDINFSFFILCRKKNKEKTFCRNKK